MPHGRSHDEIAGARSPVPEAEAEDLVSKVDQMIEQLDVVISDRARGQAHKLPAWDAPNRGVWEEDFHYSQVELFTVIDSLQWFKNRVAGVLEAIRDHNSSVDPLAQGAGGGEGGGW